MALSTTPVFICQYVGTKTGVRCTNAPVHGTRLCERHKGKPDGYASRLRARSVKNLLHGAEAILEEFDLPDDVKMDILAYPREIDPGVLLVEEISRTAGIISWLERKISGLEEEGEFITHTDVVTTERGMGAQGNQVDTTKTETRRQVTHWWSLLDAERKHLVNATAAALRSGIEERRVRLAERSVNALEAAMAYALMELGLDPHNDRVRSVVGASLRRALESGVEPSPGMFTEEDSREVVQVISVKDPSVKPVEF